MSESDDQAISETTIRKIDSLVSASIGDGDLPGCVIGLARHGKIVYLRAIGNRQIKPTVQPMTVDTIFDLASLTKPVATATSIMKLVDNGQLRLSDPVAMHWPEFGAKGKAALTIQDLLLHRSGLIADNSLDDYRHGTQTAWQRIAQLQPLAPVGTTFKYSDVNFLVLGEVVRRISGKDLSEFAGQAVFEPLGMSETGFRPEAALRARVAPNDQRGGEWVRGEVHDPRALLLGGVAGHAGLFSTASDLLAFGQMLVEAVNQGPHETTSLPVLSRSTARIMTSSYEVAGATRGLGWDKQSGFSSNKGTRLSESAIGHGGFTGTVLWIDPEQELVYVFLSNRLHPDGKGSVNQLAGRVLDALGEEGEE